MLIWCIYIYVLFLENEIHIFIIIYNIYITLLLITYYIVVSKYC